MKCGDNEQNLKSKVRRQNTKQEQSKHEPLGRSGAMEEWTSSTDRSHPLLVVVGKTEESVDNSVNKNSQTISMKTPVSIRSEMMT